MRSTVRRLLAPQQRLALRLLWGRRHRLQDVLAACVPGRLDLLARIYGTDKRSTAHGYTRRYEEHLRARRRSVRAVLEIGVGGITSSSGYETTAGGQSLRMWQRYFPRAQIVGLDIEPKRVQGARIHVEQGSQDDPEVLERIARRYGPFDLIIDDGSHLGRHVEASFEALFAHLNPGGIYAIEDLMTAYRADYEGGPPGLRCATRSSNGTGATAVGATRWRRRTSTTRSRSSTDWGRRRARSERSDDAIARAPADVERSGGSRPPA